MHGHATGLRPKFAEGSKCEALAHGAGIDRNYVSALEGSEYSATIDMVAKLANALGVDASALLERPPSRGNGA